MGGICLVGTSLLTLGFDARSFLAHPLLPPGRLILSGKRLLFSTRTLSPFHYLLLPFRSPRAKTGVANQRGVSGKKIEYHVRIVLESMKSPHPFICVGCIVQKLLSLSSIEFSIEWN
jgi:hypothetical protein